METDREESGKSERPDGSDLTPEPPAPTAAASPTPPASPSPSGTAGSRDYDYGETPLDAAGDTGQRAADSGAPEAADAATSDPAGTTQEGSAGHTDPATGVNPATGIHSATGLRNSTAPRAVLRPIPEGFPTPPPRPAGPNRRPAPKAESVSAPHGRRKLLIAGISVMVVLLLVVVIGGGILAYRALSAGTSTSEGPASQAPAPSEAPGVVQFSEVTVTEVGTEVGVRQVGPEDTRIHPEGEYVIVTFEVRNDSPGGVYVGENVTLETADGTTYPADQEAGSVYETDSTAYGVVDSGETAVQHRVYDVPIGSEPSSLAFDLNALDESGSLPLNG